MGISEAEWQAILAIYDDPYSKAVPRSTSSDSGDYEEIPDGAYDAAIMNVELTKSRSDRPMLKYEFQIIEGPFKNRRLWKYVLLDSEGSYKHLKADLAICGIALPRLSDLPSRFGYLVGKQLRIYTKSREGTDLKAVFIARAIGAKSAATKKAVADQFQPDDRTVAELEDEDLPF